MLDFTSSLYLGIQHHSQSLKPWRRLTTGKPAALFSPKDHIELGRKIAALQGLEDGVISQSTLHLCWDLFGILGKNNFLALMDSGAYPIAQWGLVRFAFNGNEVIKFKHHQVDNLSRALRARLQPGQRPLVVTDGWCPHCGELAPLQDYLDCVRPYNGMLIVDDTQALGVFGTNPRQSQPYGLGGGGSLRYLHMGGRRI